MFEWDEAKREANLVKHGVDFVDALEVFAARCEWNGSIGDVSTTRNGIRWSAVWAATWCSSSTRYAARCAA